MAQLHYPFVQEVAYLAKWFFFWQEITWNVVVSFKNSLEIGNGAGGNVNSCVVVPMLKLASTTGEPSPPSQIQPHHLCNKLTETLINPFPMWKVTPI